MEASDLDEASVVEHLKDATKGDTIVLPAVKGSESYRLRQGAGKGAVHISSTATLSKELKVLDLEELFSSLDTYGTGVIQGATDRGFRGLT
jgi:hypothetical protein